MPEKFNPFHKKESGPGSNTEQQSQNADQEQEQDAKVTPEIQGSGWTPGARNRTGGEHGGVYTQAFSLQETGQDAFNEAANTLTGGKNTEKPSQKKCRQLLEKLSEIGFSFDMLSSPEARHLPEDMRSALEALSKVHLTSLASTSKFVSGPEFKILSTAGERGVSSKTKQILRQTFGATIAFEKIVRPTFESQGLMSRDEMAKMRRDIKSSKEEFSYIDLKPRDENDEQFRNFIRRLTFMSGGRFHTQEISDERIRDMLTETVGEAVDALALRLSYYRTMRDEKVLSKKDDVDPETVEKTLSELQHVYSLLPPLLQGKEGAETLSDGAVAGVFTEKVLPALVKAQSDLQRMENTRNKKI